MPTVTRPIVLAIAIAAAGLGWLPGRANAGDVAYRHHPTRLVVPAPEWCGPGEPCGRWGSDRWSWLRTCLREGLPGPCQVYVARHDDAECRDFGPPGSHVYQQCRANLYYDRISLPLRAIK
jgi:hypothetical protein